MLLPLPLHRFPLPLAKRRRISSTMQRATAMKRKASFSLERRRLRPSSARCPFVRRCSVDPRRRQRAYDLYPSVDQVHLLLLVNSRRLNSLPCAVGGIRLRSSARRRTMAVRSGSSMARARRGSRWAWDWGFRRPPRAPWDLLRLRPSSRSGLVRLPFSLCSGP